MVWVSSSALNGLAVWEELNGQHLTQKGGNAFARVLRMPCCLPHVPAAATCHRMLIHLLQARMSTVLARVLTQAAP